ncbi:MAG: hypothetical protein R3302_02820 [Sulfurimonadaceae bacterium]|nr:hypothetical protein [Sulfurimonadaceae bacterium]
MNILFVDKDGFQTQTRRTLIENATSCRTALAQTLGDLHLTFKPDVFDLVILDHSIENGEACAKHILAEAPDQKILVVSNAPKCVVTRCEDCTENHVIRRLNNPTPIPNIMRMVKELDLYDCDHYDAETNLLKA